ncbi:MAG TPA: GNAT family N-acetyltransferase [Candidatus Angelobacter sp.]|nr:GNAT family N-acetyltransferase [Candidatus Angelobacter sp.]
MTVAASHSGQVLIRKCAGIEEFRACVELQKEVWKFDDLDVVPLRLFVVASKIGGQIIGAFDGDTLVGYAFSVPGSRAGHPYLHSHMLAVREDHRNSGLGRKLKLAQRDDALQRGFELIEWTFDPLEIKNAYLNIVKLGAIVRRYSVNHYGLSSSVLHRGLPTDRLIAEWWLKSKRVVNLLESDRRPVVQTAQHIDVPAEIYAWRGSQETLPKAEEVQKRNRQQFLQAFSEGLTGLGYQRDAAGNGSFLLGEWDETWSYASEDGDED